MWPEEAVTDLCNTDGRVHVRLKNQHWLESLDDELWTDDDERSDPQRRQDDGGPSDRVHVTRAQGVTDRVVSATTRQAIHD